MNTVCLEYDENQVMAPSTSQITILERVAAGEQGAVEDCLAHYGNLVWALARRLSSSAADAEDATQEIFTEVWQNADRFDPDKASESTFITMIARRRLIDRLRRSNRSPLSASLTVEALDVSGYDDGGDQVELAEEAAKARECMRHLPKAQLQVIALSIHQGLSHANISEKLEMPLGTVKSYARRALLQLRECMLRRALPQGGAQ